MTKRTERFARSLDAEGWAMVRQWMPLAGKIAKESRPYRRLDGDLFRDTAIDGLIEAVATFDRAEGLPIGTWIGWVVRRRIIDLPRNNKNLRLRWSSASGDVGPDELSRDHFDFFVFDNTNGHVFPTSDASLPGRRKLSGRHDLGRFAGFPDGGLADEDACYASLSEWLHPGGLGCPRCKKGDLLRPHRHRKKFITDYRCGYCKRVFNLFTGTAFQNTSFAPSEIISILRGFANGVPIRRFSRETGFHRFTLMRIRQRLDDAVGTSSDPPESSAS